MRPHLQSLFSCLATFFSVCQDVSFVNILHLRKFFAQMLFCIDIYPMGVYNLVRR